MVNTDFSYNNRLFKFALVDDQVAASLGFPPKNRRKYPDVLRPANTMQLLDEWGHKRSDMLERIRKAGVELLQWCAGNYRQGLKQTANELLKELPDEPNAHRALGETYSKELGWVTGIYAEKVKQGLLPYGKGWQKRELVIELRSDWANAWHVSSDYFKVRTNTSPELARQLIVYLKALRKGWLRYFSGFKAPYTTGKLQINLFAKRSEFTKISDILFPGVGLRGAYYCSQTKCTYIVAYSGRNGFLYAPALVAHEHSHQFTHQFLNAPARRYYEKPGAWINEGLASYCESVRQFADRVTFAGYRHIHHFNGARRGILEGRAPSLRFLTTITGDEFLRSNQRHINYNMGMALISYFMHADGGKYRSRFYRYVRGVTTGKGSKTYFKHCFGITPEDLDPIFRKWVVEGESSQKH